MNYRLPILYNNDVTSIEYDTSDNPTVLWYSNGQRVTITYKPNGYPDVVSYLNTAGQLVETQQFNANTNGNLMSLIKQQGVI